MNVKSQLAQFYTKHFYFIFYVEHLIDKNILGEKTLISCKWFDILGFKGEIDESLPAPRLCKLPTVECQICPNLIRLV